jgi:hypothetical protein
VRHYIWDRGQETLFPALKVPRQCPFVLMVDVMHIIEIFSTLERVAL